MKIDKNIVLDLIYPQRCPLCGKIRSYRQSGACADCFTQLKPVAAPHCMRCGKAITSDEGEYCQDCEAISKSFKRGFPVFEYVGSIRDALYDFKYHNRRDHAAFFAECVEKYYGKQLKELRLDGIVPVPIHKKKKKSRGYNQAELLAKELSKRLHIPMYPYYLVRQINTSPQKELNDIARMKNLKNAFKIGKNTVQLNKILLVDDIYTTGATIEACTGVLLSSGAQDVYYTSVAIGQGYSE